MLKRSILSDQLLKQISDHQRERGLRYVVEVDRATLVGLIKEYNELYNYILATGGGETYSHYDRIKAGIRAALSNMEHGVTKADVYYKVIESLQEEMKSV